MALKAAEKSGLSLIKILKVIPSLKPVEGRFEKSRVGIFNSLGEVFAPPE